MLQFQDEALYRKSQRQLGEILVAITLTKEARKQNPTLPGLDMALQGLLDAKHKMLDRIKAMESSAYLAPGRG